MLWMVMNMVSIAFLLGVPTDITAEDGKMSRAGNEERLDRLIELHRERLLKEATGPVELEAYLDSQPTTNQNDEKSWAFDKVVLLLILLKNSQSAAGIHRAVREALIDPEAYRRNSDGTSPIVHIKNHLQVQLPGKEIRLQTVMDLLKPHIFHTQNNPLGRPVKTVPRPAIPPVHLGVKNLKDKIRGPGWRGGNSEWGKGWGGGWSSRGNGAKGGFNSGNGNWVTLSNGNNGTWVSCTNNGKGITCKNVSGVISGLGGGNEGGNGGNGGWGGWNSGHGRWSTSNSDHNGTWVTCTNDSNGVICKNVSGVSGWGGVKNGGAGGIFVVPPSGYIYYNPNGKKRSRPGSPGGRWRRNAPGRPGSSGV